MLSKTNRLDGSPNNGDKFAQYMVSDREKGQILSTEGGRQSSRSMVRAGMCDCLGSKKVNLSCENHMAFYSKQYCSGCGEIKNRKKSGASSFADFMRRVLSPADFQMLVNDFLRVSIEQNDGAFAFMRCEESSKIQDEYRENIESIADFMSELDEEGGL